MAQSNCGRGGRMAPPGSNKRMGAKQVSCQDFVITIREGRHQFSWHKKQERLRISPSDTVMVLTSTMAACSAQMSFRDVQAPSVWFPDWPGHSGLWCRD